MTEAILLRGAGKMGPAEEAHRKAVKVYPQGDQAWAELGIFLADTKVYSEASGCLRRSLGLPPEAAATDPGSSAKAGVEDATRETIRLLAKILAAHPAWTRGQFSLGGLYETIGEYELSRASLARALALEASVEAPVRALLARILWREGKLEEAIAQADRALELDPANLLAHAGRSVCCSLLGFMDEAMVSYRRSNQISPEAACHELVLFGMNFLPETTPEAFYDEARRWDSLHAAPLACHIRPPGNVPDPDRRLKIGYVSPDLHTHPIVRFLLPVLEHHDGSRFEVTAYSVNSTTDVQTEELQRVAPNWVTFLGTGLELADRVRADGIDILVDLAGHTMECGLYQVFMCKPAPIQVSWMGMLSTTGLSTMDYFLGDALMPCPGTEHLFSETVYRVPGASFCYRPAADVPLAPSPCRERGYITFGSFHQTSKVTREVVRLWATVLHAVPGSRLLMKYRDMGTDAAQRRFAIWFAEDGIGKERLQFAAASPLAEYLAAFGEIDIALDTFPYNGGTTSLDGLWMGVPFVTLAGRLAVQRTGADILTLIGSPGLAAETWEQYLRAAVFLAEAVPQNPDFRRNVRQALKSSSMMDEAAVVRRVEDAFRDMWRTWCQSGKGAPRTAAMASQEEVFHAGVVPATASRH
jgi:predicted O-linked N-acetylglucosamine transferase (SPINDLY family)